MKLKTVLVCLLISTAVLAHEWRHISTVHDGSGRMSANTVVLDGVAYTNMTAGCQPGGINTSGTGPWTNNAGFLQAVDIKRPGLDTDADGTIDELDLDNDNDMLADIDEVTGALFDPANPTAVNLADTDGDGVLDGSEFIALTDPNDEFSYFWVEGIGYTNRMDVEFTSSASRVYTLERCLNLNPIVWTQVPGMVDVAGTDAMFILSDTNQVDLSLGYYRVKVATP